MAVLGATVGLLLVVPAGAEVEPAGPITFTATDGVIKAGTSANEGTGGPHGVVMPLSCTPGDMLPEFPAVNLQSLVDPECDPNAPAPELAGTVDSDGSILIDSIEFPETEPAEALPGVMVAMNIQAAGPATGTIDPEAGTLEMFVNLAINVDISSDFLNGVCDIPLNLHLTGTYNPETGKALIADNTFAIVVKGGADPEPSCNPGGLAGLVGTIVGNLASGNNVVRFAMDVDPIITVPAPAVGPPVVNDTSATILIGQSATRTITSLSDPPQTCELVGANGGATRAAEVTLNGFQVSYVHDASAGAGIDTVDYRCENSEGPDTGTLTVTINTPAPPVIGDSSLTITVGQTGVATIPVTTELDGLDDLVVTGGGEDADDVSIALVGGEWKITYVHDADNGPGSDSVTYEGANQWGVDAGTLTVTVTAGTSPPPPPPPPTAGDTFLDKATATIAYECVAADSATQGLLNALWTQAGEPGPFVSLEVDPVVTMDAVVPSPQQGQGFTAKFSMALGLPADIVDGLIGFGVTNASIKNVTWRIIPHAGVSGSNLNASPPDQSISLVAGQAATGQLGPVSGSFTRTSAIGNPVAFRSDRLTMTMTVESLGINVSLRCDPSGANVLSASDKSGTPPPPTPPAPPSAPPVTTPPTTAPPAAPGGPGAPGGAPSDQVRYLPEVSVDATYSCSVTDPEVEEMLALLAGEPLGAIEVVPRVRMASVIPAPAQGEQFTASFSMSLGLPADIVNDVIELGLTEATLKDLSWTITPHAGVTGDDIVGRPPAQVVRLVAGQPAAGQIGPFSGTFTRTSAVGEPVAFRSEALALTISVEALGIGVEVPLACTAVAGNVLSAVDQMGDPSVLAAGRLPSTGLADATRAYVIAALGLLAVGFVLTGADAPLATRRRRG